VLQNVTADNTGYFENMIDRPEAMKY